MRNKPYRKGGRLIEFVVDEVFIVVGVCSGFTGVLRNLGSGVLKNLPKIGKILSWIGLITILDFLPSPLVDPC
jgi:hypothetical protein